MKYSFRWRFYRQFLIFFVCFVYFVIFLFNKTVNLVHHIRSVEGKKGGEGKMLKWKFLETGGKCTPIAVLSELVISCFVLGVVHSSSQI
jgi:hypothetical protein